MHLILESPKTTSFESDQPTSSLLKQLFLIAALIDAVDFCAHQASFVGIAPIAVDSDFNAYVGGSDNKRAPAERRGRQVQPRTLVCVDVVDSLASEDPLSAMLDPQFDALGCDARNRDFRQCSTTSSVGMMGRGSFAASCILAEVQ